MANKPVSLSIDIWRENETKATGAIYRQECIRTTPRRQFSLQLDSRLSSDQIQLESLTLDVISTTRFRLPQISHVELGTSYTGAFFALYAAPAESKTRDALRLVVNLLSLLPL